MRRSAAVIGQVILALASILASASPAAAHERRTVGPYQFVVGWLSEPAVQGQPNGASVRITDPRVTPAKAMEGLEKAISIEVRYAGLSTPFTGELRAVFGQPGLYALDIIPTASGAYTFRIKGRIESLDVDERFESGPGRFNDVEAQDGLQYPAKAPAGGDLAARLEAIERGAMLASVLGGAALVVALVAVALRVGRRRI